MLPEELLRPRFKLIADYPGNTRPVGFVFVMDSEDSEGRYTTTGYLLESFFTQYPHLFKPLEWWEERSVEDMPQYVKEVDSLYKIGEVIKVAEWEYCDDNMIWSFRDEKDNHFTWIRGFIPATESEYNAYLNTK